MQRHERFVEMCALAPLGELSARERRELDEHLLVCEPCRQAASEFDSVLPDMPAALRERVMQEQAEHAPARFLERAREDGLEFSDEVAARWKKHEAPITVPFDAIRQHLPAFVTGALAALLLIAGWIEYQRFVSVPPSATIVSAPRIVPAPPVTVAVATPLADDDVKTQALEKEVQQLQAERGRLREELASATAQYREQSAALGEVQARLAEALKGAAASSDEANKLRAERDEMIGTLIARQQRISELTDKLNDQAAAAEQDRRLAAAAHDVRQLMGERNLHIIDVFDVESNGRSKKSFGRVFYTEGKSLIFYAFDLPSKGRGAKRATFQAWGQRSQQPIATNLGVFTVDDPAQNRWILKVDDAKLLSNFDMVFVTMERPGGAEQPTGNRVLYAYLKNPINHP